jgi:hypothetical protein
VIWRCWTDNTAYDLIRHRGLQQLLTAQVDTGLSASEPAVAGHVRLTDNPGEIGDLVHGQAGSASAASAISAFSKHSWGGCTRPAPT